MDKNFTHKIISWYLVNKRDLPWRDTQDPYTIWLSEIILQQTRVEQGLPYFERFIDEYPTIQEFADASEKDILKMWQGLGYYSRARNMMVCAQTIVNDYGGRFPENYKSLIKLKGIGKYTAAAIASISFREPVSVIDGNVYRVLSRVFGIESDLSNANTYNIFFQKAQELIDVQKPDMFNQSIMEFGALFCTPRNPKCEDCIFSKSCYASIHDLQEDLPVKTKKIKKRIRYFSYYVITHNGKMLIRKRTGKDIWNGLYDFVLREGDNRKHWNLESDESIRTSFGEGELFTFSKEYKHILTHQTIFARFYQVGINRRSTFDDIKNKNSLVEIEKNDLEEYPVPVLIQNYLKNDYI